MSLIIDGGSVAGKAFFATHSNTTVFDSRNFTDAFLKALFGILADLSAHSKRVVLCMDSVSWRHGYFPPYKQNRKALKATVPYKEYKDYLHDFAAEIKGSGLPIAVVKKMNYEADDLVAYFAKRRPPWTNHVVLVSGDKDIVQLYQENLVWVYNWVDRQFVPCKDVPLYKHTLICHGDSSDGIPSIVPRDANGKLIKKFGPVTIEKLYDVSEPLSIHKSFWVGLSKDHKEEAEKAYARNQKLIDLDHSPILTESIHITEPRYDRSTGPEFLKTHMAEHFYRNQQRLLALLEHYGT